MNANHSVQKFKTLVDCRKSVGIINFM